MKIIAVLIDVILPVFIIIGIGAAAGRRLSLRAQTLSRSVLYIFSPALIFRSLFTTELTAEDAGQIVAFVLITTAVLGVIAWSTTRVLRFDIVQSNAFLLSVLLTNSGNYGLPVALFAFGDRGLERAVLFFVVTAVLVNTVGVYLAARGRATSATALLKVFRMPMIYAVALAFTLRVIGVRTLPDALFRPLDLLANAAIPVLLTVLGIELAEASLTHELRPVVLATATRLVAAAGVAVLIATLMGLQGLTRQVCILQASMPTAIFSVVLAVEFDARPHFVTSVVFVSTLASAFTLTLLLSLLI